jgi:hypothetical protein
VDLLLERDRKIIAVECKIREQPQRKDLQGIERLRKFYGKDEVSRAYVACPTDVPFDLQRGTTAVSGWEAWTLGL